MGEPWTTIVGWAAVIAFVLAAAKVHELSEYKAREERRLETIMELQMLRDRLTRPMDYPGGEPEGSYALRQDTAALVELFGAHETVVKAVASGDWRTVNKILTSSLESDAEEESSEAPKEEPRTEGAGKGSGRPRSTARVKAGRK